MSKFTDAVKRLKKSVVLVAAAALTVGGVSMIGLSQSHADVALITQSGDGYLANMGYPEGTYIGTYLLGNLGVKIVCMNPGETIPSYAIGHGSGLSSGTGITPGVPMADGMVLNTQQVAELAWIAANGGGYSGPALNLAVRTILGYSNFDPNGAASGMAGAGEASGLLAAAGYAGIRRPRGRCHRAVAQSNCAPRCPLSCDQRSRWVFADIAAKPQDVCQGPSEPHSTHRWLPGWAEPRRIAARPKGLLAQKPTVARFVAGSSELCSRCVWFASTCSKLTSAKR